MIPKLRGGVSLLVMSILVAVTSASCSSAEGDDAAVAGAGASTMAGSSAGGAAAGTGAGGAPAAGTSSAGAPAAGATATAGTGAGECMAIATPVGCTGIRGTTTACAPEASICADLPCGVSDVGRRTCTCTGGFWMCERCMFPDPANCPIVAKPATPLPACTPAMLEDSACPAARGERCMQGTQVCICWPDDEGNAIWNCDAPPSSWAM